MFWAIEQQIAVTQAGAWVTAQNGACDNGFNEGYLG